MQRGKQTICRILVIVFALYYANISFFYHSHIINGVTIVHSHFYYGDHAKANTTAPHSENELTLIASLSSFQTLQPALFFAGVSVFFLLVATIGVVSEKKAVVLPVVTRSLRAPPFLF